MTSPARVYCLVEAVRYVLGCGVEGAIVVCGVARGGSMMAVALTLIDQNAANRHLYLYDPFEGMPRPTDRDVRWNGQSAAEKFAQVCTSERGSDWCRSAIDEVKVNLGKTGYPPELCHYIKGLAEETIPATVPDQIAILRLDTDWYQSTRHELEHLYPRLVSGGVLIIDDYGDWQGARRAVDEWIASGLPILLNRIDTTGADRHQAIDRGNCRS
jgi:O-methyltransferase